MEFLTGNKFIGIAEFTFAPSRRAEDDYTGLTNTFDISKLKDDNIVYTHTTYVKELFEVIKPLPNRFVVITHNSDINVDDSFILPDNVIKWYSQNVNVRNERIESIPIGLENDIWFPEIQKKSKMARMLTRKKSCRNWAFMNHNIKTNPDERSRMYELFRKQHWITTESGKNGQEFDRYLENIYNHRYVLCPKGNGMDTHRFWECLYMGTIPVVKKDINNWFYHDMRVLFVDDWEEVTEELLATRWNDFKGEFNTDKLNIEYWNGLLRNTSVSIIGSPQESN
jgi:hypothetical protein